jgi:hypothetical protein
MFGTRNNRQYRAIAILHTFQFIVTHALGFSVFTSRILATDLSQTHCNFKSQVKSSCHSLIRFLLFLLSHFRVRSTELDPILFLLDYFTSRLLVSYYFVASSLSLYNSSERTPLYTPCLLVRYLAMDVLFSRALVLRECVYRAVT